jgi:acetyl esterase
VADADPREEALEMNRATAEAMSRLPLPPAIGTDEFRRIVATLRFPPEGRVVHSERAEAITIGDGPGVPLRVIRGAEPAAVYMFLHGGGWATGSCEFEDQRLENIVSETGLSAVSVDYRLAPEHPYPAALDDCEAAVRWVLDNGEHELGSGRLVLAGLSAGANLAVATLVRLASERPQADVAAAILVSGVYDLRLTPSARRGNDAATLLPKALLEWFCAQYALSPEDAENPEISPLFADLTGLPPTLVIVGSEDPLLDDSLFLHARLNAAGVQAELHVAPGGDHGFDGQPLAIAEAARERYLSFVRSQVKSPTGH